MRKTFIERDFGTGKHSVNGLGSAITLATARRMKSEMKRLQSRLGK